MKGNNAPGAVTCRLGTAEFKKLNRVLMGTSAKPGLDGAFVQTLERPRHVGAVQSAVGLPKWKA